LRLYDYPPALYWSSYGNVSSLMTETIADPWASGTFDHLISQSPLPWPSTYTLPRSPLSSCEGSEPVYPGIKADYGGRWTPEVQWGTTDPAHMHRMTSPQPQPPTVAPERLNAGMYSYNNSFEPPSLKLESNATCDNGNWVYERAPSKESASSEKTKAWINYSSTSVPRVRTDPTNATFRCSFCPEMKFRRKDYLEQHKLTHLADRQKEHACLYPGCKKQYYRKQDLTRHGKSVHPKSRALQCSQCPKAFARKDALDR
jgi:hypothetical protein